MRYELTTFVILQLNYHQDAACHNCLLFIRQHRLSGPADGTSKTRYLGVYSGKFIYEVRHDIIFKQCPYKVSKWGQRSHAIEITLRY